MRLIDTIGILIASSTPITLQNQAQRYLPFYLLPPRRIISITITITISNANGIHGIRRLGLWLAGKLANW